MSAQLHKDETGMTRREELAVSRAALSGAPWAAAGAAGTAVSVADLLWHIVGGHLALTGSLSAGAVAFFAVAGGGMLVRGRRSRAVAWARRNPWRFALLPALATSMVVYVLVVILGSSGIVGGALSALWHGAIVYGLTGITGSVAGRRRTAG
jgi:hypothetical protein